MSLKVSVLDEFHCNIPVCFVLEPAKNLNEMLLILYQFMLDLTVYRTINQLLTSTTLRLENVVSALISRFKALAELPFRLVICLTARQIFDQVPARGGTAVPSRPLHLYLPLTSTDFQHRVPLGKS